MLTRRRFVSYSALSTAMLAHPPLLRAAMSPADPLRLCVIGSVYKHGSAMQDITDRFLIGYPYGGEWHMPNVQVVSMYVDQRMRRLAAMPTDFDRAETPGGRVAAAFYAEPANRAAGQNTPSAQGGQRGQRGQQGGANAQRGQGGQSAQRRQNAQRAAGFGLPTDPSDLSADRAEKFNFRIYRNIQDALRNGGSSIAVDAVLCIIEPDDYPMNDKGQELLPNYDFFQQCKQVFDEEKHPLPYFNYGQLSFSSQEAQSMIKTAEQLKIPLLAGSALPVTWRLPEVDIPQGAQVHEAVMVGANAWGGTDFDALEAMQALLERRKGGETGVKAVQLLEGDDVWTAWAAGRWSKELLSSALARSDTPQGLTLLDGRTQDLTLDSVLPQLVKNPAAYCVEYTDGTKGTMLMLDGAIKDFNFSARVEGHGLVSMQFFRPLPPNFGQTACLAAKVEELFMSKAAPYTAKRTALTSGILEAAMISRRRLNARVDTPHLNVSYSGPAKSQFNQA